MANKSITVTKTLHKENSFVLSMAYMSASKPILREVVQDGLREYEGTKHIRTSQDNGKTWTVVGVDDWEEQRGERTARRDAGNFLIDRKNNVVIQFILDNEYGPEGDYHSFGPEADGMPLQSRTGRIFYRFSRDEGATWTDAKQLIQDGAGYDSTHWADGLVYGRNAVLFSELMRAVQLRDGTLLVPISYFRWRRRPFAANGTKIKATFAGRCPTICPLPRKCRMRLRNHPSWSWTTAD